MLRLAEVTQVERCENRWTKSLDFWSLSRLSKIRNIFFSKSTPRSSARTQIFIETYEQHRVNTVMHHRLLEKALKKLTPNPRLTDYRL